MSTWENWLARTTNGASGRAIAAAIGSPNSTVARWTTTGLVPAEGAVMVARAYNADPIEALIVAGYLTPDDDRRRDAVVGVRNASTLELLEELIRRELGSAQQSGEKRK
jgi:hypothetical protein